MFVTLLDFEIVFFRSRNRIYEEHILIIDTAPPSPAREILL
jgi:hypothetical protein